MLGRCGSGTGWPARVSSMAARSSSPVTGLPLPGVDWSTRRGRPAGAHCRRGRSPACRRRGRRGRPSGRRRPDTGNSTRRAGPARQARAAGRRGKHRRRWCRCPRRPGQGSATAACPARSRRGGRRDSGWLGVRIMGDGPSPGTGCGRSPSKRSKCSSTNLSRPTPPASSAPGRVGHAECPDPRFTRDH